MTLEQCFKKVDKYLTSSSTTPRFVNIQNIQDLNTFLNYYHVGNNRFFTVSDYCKADEIMRIDELQNDLLSQNDNVFITRLTSYFKLQGKAVLIKQLQNFSSRSFNTHVVILCYQCEEYLNFKDNIRTSQFIYKVDGDISDIANIVFISPEIPVPSDAKIIHGIHNIANTLEQTDGGKIYVITKKSKSTFPNSIIFIEEENNAFDVLCNIDENTKSLYSHFGTTEQWNVALQNISKYGCWENWISKKFGVGINYAIYQWNHFTEQEKWLYFIALKMKPTNDNWCIEYAISQSYNYEVFMQNIYRSILSLEHTNKDYWEKYDIRKKLLISIGGCESEAIDYIKMVKSKQQYAIYYLSDSSKYEKEMILELLYQYSEQFSKKEIKNILHHIYPDMADYISVYHFDSEVLTKYFNEYCYQKMVNKIDTEFLKTVNHQAKLREFNLLLPHRAEKVEKLNKNKCKLYFVNALGAEYLGFITAKCREKNINVAISVCRCELPSITCFNKEFLNSFSLEQIMPTIKSLDHIKHHAEENYEKTKLPFHLIQELEIVDEIISNIKATLEKDDMERVYMISDYGSSRLAMIHESECQWKMTSNGQYFGRCCTVNEMDIQSEYIIQENGFWILANYDRLKGNKTTSMEVHGGASLEEIVVPIIEFTNKIQNIEFIIDTKLPITIGFRKKAQIQLFSKTILENVSVCVKSDSVRGFEEKRYHAEYCDNNIYKIDMPDIKRAGSYQLDVYSHTNLVTSALNFTVKKEIGSERDLL